LRAARLRSRPTPSPRSCVIRCHTRMRRLPTRARDGCRGRRCSSR